MVVVRGGWRWFENGGMVGWWWLVVWHGGKWMMGVIGGRNQELSSWCRNAS